MKAVDERDIGRAAGGVARDLQRVFDGFRTGREERGLARTRGRRDRIEPLGQFDITLIGQDLDEACGDVAEEVPDPSRRIPKANADDDLYRRQRGDADLPRILRPRSGVISALG
jgi:hypothetical protein